MKLELLCLYGNPCSSRFEVLKHPRP